MRGNGTVPVATPNNARLLDVTRLIRREDQRPTGIDRVERAYLRHLLAAPEPLMGLVRTRLGYLLLDQAGLNAVLGQPNVGCARKYACGRCPVVGLGGMLKSHLRPGFWYINVGHSNFTPRVVGALRKAGCDRIMVMLHDTIPLDAPSTQRADTIDKFRDFIRNIASSATHIIFTTHAARAKARPYLERAGSGAEEIIAPIGVDLPNASAVAVEGARWPYFVALGTIEPRKNHGFLLDIWEEMGAHSRSQPMPQLHIIGRRGWCVEELWSRMEASELRGRTLFLHGALSDGESRYLVENATALLFPSIVEGFGLPPLEALSLGTNVLCSDENVSRETIGKHGMLLETSNHAVWTAKINELAQHSPATIPKPSGFSPPTWRDHFNTALTICR